MHGHDDEDLMSDSVLTTSQEGIRALQWSLLSLLLTAVMQIVIVAISGSVALLADTIHNFADATTAIPLWIAFALNRRQPARGFTYRYGKAEDLAGAFVVLVIFGSALVIFYETWQKLLHPEPMRNLAWVAAAAIIGFVGNEAAAYVRIRSGRRIGSAALVADGMHARTDGLTSLAVLVGAIGAWLGGTRAVGRGARGGGCRSLYRGQSRHCRRNTPRALSRAAAPARNDRPCGSLATAGRRSVTLPHDHRASRPVKAYPIKRQGPAEARPVAPSPGPAQ